MHQHILWRICCLCLSERTCAGTSLSSPMTCTLFSAHSSLLWIRRDACSSFINFICLCVVQKKHSYFHSVISVTHASSSFVHAYQLHMWFFALAGASVSFRPVLYLFNHMYLMYHFPSILLSWNFILHDNV